MTSACLYLALPSGIYLFRTPEGLDRTSEQFASSSPVQAFALLEECLPDLVWGSVPSIGGRSPLLRWLPESALRTFDIIAGSDLSWRSLRQGRVLILSLTFLILSIGFLAISNIEDSGEDATIAIPRFSIIMPDESSLPMEAPSGNGSVRDMRSNLGEEVTVPPRSFFQGELFRSMFRSMAELGA